MIPPSTRLHFVGIGGAGMSAVAQVLAERGFRVSGCDRRESTATQRLRRLGVRVDLGHSAKHLEGADLVVLSRAIAQGNDEVQAARRLGIPTLHRAAILNEIMAAGWGVAVVGTHGKTTTTAMLTRILRATGLDPTALIGAEVAELGGNARTGHGPWVVAEVDESDGSLLHVVPRAAVLTSLDVTDHRDFYTSLAHLEETFATFLRRVDPGGFIAVGNDHPGVRSLVAGLARPVVTYGFDRAAEVRGVLRVADGEVTRATVFLSDRPAGDLTLQVPGRHNVSNALGALAAALKMGVPLEGGIAALAGFRGVSRRLEVRGEAAGVLVIDDYAHNPVKVAAALHAAREGWPHRRLIALFQPHRFSRTHTTHAEFAHAFDEADDVVVTDIYPADEPPIPGVSAQLIVDAVAAHRAVHYRATAVEALDLIESLVSRESIVLTLGAGDIGDAAGSLLSRLSARAPAASMPRSEAASGGPA